MLDRQGKRDAAIDMLREALEMRRRTLGPAPPGRRGVRHEPRLLADRRRPVRRGAGLVEESLAIRRKALGPEHPQVAGTLTVQANLMLARGRYEEARAVAVEAQRILKLSLPDDSWQAAAARNTEGAALAKLGDYAGAEPLLLASLPSLEHSPIPGLPEVGRKRLRELYLAWGRPAEANKYLGQSLTHRDAAVSTSRK